MGNERALGVFIAGRHFIEAVEKDHAALLAELLLHPGKSILATAFMQLVLEVIPHQSRAGPRLSRRQPGGKAAQHDAHGQGFFLLGPAGEFVGIRVLAQTAVGELRGNVIHQRALAAAGLAQNHQSRQRGHGFHRRDRDFFLGLFCIG